MARGNPYARGGDPMKTRSEKRREKKSKLAKTGRVKRLKYRLKGIRNRKDKREGNHHTTALMESYVTRRKNERAEEKRKAKLAEEEEAKKLASSGDQALTTKNLSALAVTAPMATRKPPLPTSHSAIRQQQRARPAPPVARTRSIY